MGARRGCAWQTWRLRLYTSAGGRGSLGVRVLAGGRWESARASKWEQAIRSVARAACSAHDPDTSSRSHGQSQPGGRPTQSPASAPTSAGERCTLQHSRCIPSRYATSAAIQLTRFRSLFRYLPPTPGSCTAEPPPGRCISFYDCAWRAFAFASAARRSCSSMSLQQVADEYRAPCEHTQSRRTLLPKGSPAYHTDNRRELASNPKIAQIDLTRRLRSRPRRNICMGEIEV